jgi:hypothetical protein
LETRGGLILRSAIIGSVGMLFFLWHGHDLKLQYLMEAEKTYGSAYSADSGEKLAIFPIILEVSRKNVRMK